jgi:hypothetical protein
MQPKHMYREQVAVRAAARLRGRDQQGFTVLEVLIGVLLMTVGLLAVFAMQITAIETNRASYDLRAATELAETTLERIERDSLMWGQSGDPGDYGGGAWLNGAMGTTVTDTWAFPPRPAGVIGGRQPTWNDMGLAQDDAARWNDYRGRNSKFCVNYLADWLRGPTFVRVTVMVRWPRNRGGEQALRNDCSRLNELTEAVLLRDFYEVRATGPVRMPQ